MHKLKCLLLIFTLYASFSPVAAYAGSCKVSSAVERNGYIVADQTQAQNEDMLINHVLAIIGGVISTIKMINARCVGFTPSYYLRNSASVVGMLAAIKAMLDEAKESKKKLEAYIGDQNNPDLEKVNEQIAALEQAEQITLDAYRATKKKEKIYKLVSTLQRSAIAAAVIEIFTSKTTPPNPLMHHCFPNEQAMIAAKAKLIGTNPEAENFSSDKAIDKYDKMTSEVAKDGANFSNFTVNEDTGNFQLDGANVANFEGEDPIQAMNGGKSVWDDGYGESQKLGDFGANAEVFAAGKTIAGGILMQAVVRMVLGEYAGEQTPETRAVYYGTMELISLALSGDKADAADCLKERADEYGNLADNLRQRFNVRASEVEIGNTVNVASETLDLQLTQDDIGGCAGVQNNQISASPSFCSQPLQIPPATFTGSQASDLGFGVPAGFINGVQTANRSVNATLAGNPARGASLASDIGSNAFSKKNLDKLKELANKKRVAEGKAPIDFDGLAQRTHSALKKGVGAALRKAGINSIADFNRAFLDGKPLLAKASPKLDKETKGSTTNPFENTGSKEKASSNTGLSFGSFLEDAKDASLDDQLADAQSANLGQFEVSGNDYSKDKTGDLFKIITTRYFKTGYSSLLDEKLDEKPKKDKP